MGRTRETDLIAEYTRDAAGDSRPAALTRYLGRIAAAATATHPGLTIESAVRCRRRPDRTPCEGFILVRRQELPAEIQWGCPTCHDRGIIRNWRGTPWDVSRPGRVDEDEIEVVLAEEAYRLLEGNPLLDPASDRLVHGGKRHRRGISIEGSAPDLDILLEDVMALANDEQSRGRQLLLDRAADRIEAALRRWRR
jgi:hypothetical protein